MGTWGFGVLQDDVAADAYADYLDRFDRTGSPEETLAYLRQQIADYDPADDLPRAWFGIAKAQWQCGHLAPEVIELVERFVTDGRCFDPYADAGPKALNRYRANLTMFLSRLKETNPKPRKRKLKATKRKPSFAVGDCVAFRLPDGKWGAALVTYAEPPNDDPWTETYGVNIVAALRYHARERPRLEHFTKQEWVVMTFEKWCRGKPLAFQIVSAAMRRTPTESYELVGRITVPVDDPANVSAYGDLVALGEYVIRQFDWERATSAKA